MGTAARRVRLFLIRHGETVDNVAQLYAGSRDSALTNHGYQQATRLGLHFRDLGLRFTHLFSSHLQRAAKTAGLIREAQTTFPADVKLRHVVPDVIQLPVLMEQDFGFYEGKKWYERAADSKLAGREQHRQQHKDTAGFVDVESAESMAQRADTFLDSHLLPLFESSVESTDLIVAIVSHGIMLSALWKRLLLRLPPKSVSFAPELSESVRGRPLEHLGGWSNTGYLELLMEKTATNIPISAIVANPGVESGLAQPAAVESEPGPSKTKNSPIVVDCAPTDSLPAVDGSSAIAVSAAPMSHVRVAPAWTTVIRTMNGRDHLMGLKRTGGGVGSSKHDASQKSIESFFKRRKVG